MRRALVCLLLLSNACAGGGSPAVGTGGSPGSGGSSPGTGGSGSGGAAPGTGGGTATGGVVGSGGTVGTGGIVATGGTVGSGGSAGRAATGGAAGTGGQPGSGGSAGRAATGGTTGTGGTTSTGGTTGTGGTSGPAMAFPGAQGFAKAVTGGRNGVVYHVTNLNDSGSGSFRDAVSSSNRIIVFDVGGYVQLKTAVSAKSNLTIAGQTAPGGIGFMGGEVSFASQSNIIMRHVRIRPGSDTASTEDDALSLYRAHDVIVDHSSLEFAPWNNIDGVSDDWQNYPVTNITFQDCLIADPTGQQFGAHTESVNSNWSWYRNIFANSHNRNPLAKVNTVFVNNLLYNDSAGYTTHTSTTFQHDILNNYFIFGPASTGTDNTWYQIDKNQAIYYAGNLKDSNLDGTLNGAATTPYWYQGTGTVLTKPWSSETTATPALDAPSAARVAMSQAGPLPRDQIDTLVISQVMTLGKGTTGTGAGTVGPGGSLYTSQTQTGLGNNGYGTIISGARPTDTDNDGMPDNWESAMGLNPASDDAMAKAGDGYAHVEEYVNWLAGPHATSSGGAAASVDLSAYTAGFGPVSPTYKVSAAQNGTVALASDGHTAQFQPSSGFHGLGSFTYQVSGSDGTSATNQVAVLIAP